MLFLEPIDLILINLVNKLLGSLIPLSLGHGRAHPVIPFFLLQVTHGYPQRMLLHFLHLLLVPRVLEVPILFYLRIPHLSFFNPVLELGIQNLMLALLRPFSVLNH